eukprot:scaffold101242_cov63-Phaeocystis_antarctica.AAC.1
MEAVVVKGELLRVARLINTRFPPGTRRGPAQYPSALIHKGVSDGPLALRPSTRLCLGLVLGTYQFAPVL